MKVLGYRLYSSFPPKALKFCLLGTLLMVSLIFTGCSGKEILGENSIEELQSQISNYQRNQSKTWGNTAKSVNDYIDDEKEHFNDVPPQFTSYKQGQTEDFNKLKVTLKRWMDVR